MKIRKFSCSLFLPRPLDEVFPFFSDAHNLEQITPSWLNFKVLTPSPVEMKPGTLIDYKIRLRGLPIRWQSEITIWEPGVRFVDEQRRGPYRQWHHEHRFESRDGGTLCTDVVHYAVWFDFMVHALLIRPDIERIFAFRQKELARLFPARMATEQC